VDEESRRYLGQLQDRDILFVNGLIEGRDIKELEYISLNLSVDEEKRLQAAITALSALTPLQKRVDKSYLNYPSSKKGFFNIIQASTTWS
jgi:hypothetical protein